MDNLSIILFLITSLSLLAGAIWLMSRGITSQYVDPGENYRTGTWTTQVVKRVHPEMEGVEPGEELMGVTFEKKTSCDLEEYKDLQARIEELKAELEADDEEEDDGDIIVRV